jgi:hypothetical protein
MRKYAVAMLALLFVVPFWAAAQVSPPGVSADIPFSFTLAGKSYPAGNYSFTENTTMSAITIMAKDGKQSAVVPYLTRLSSRSLEQADLVFDVVGSDHYLSEVYMPGMDGFAFKAASSTHTHMTVKAKK